LSDERASHGLGAAKKRDHGVVRAVAILLMGFTLASVGRSTCRAVPAIIGYGYGAGGRGVCSGQAGAVMAYVGSYTRLIGVTDPRAESPSQNSIKDCKVFAA
jgi:hypothetical protein